MTAVSRHVRRTGRAIPRKDLPWGNPPSSAGAPAMVAKFLRSCGYAVGTLSPARDGWMRTQVTDRATGEPRGTRWVRRTPMGRYEVRSVAP
jgi:hypothetical protein